MKRLAGLAVILIVLGTIRLAHAGTTAGIPPTPVTITASEYSFDAPDQLSAGLVAITFVNAGSKNHNLSLARLKDGKTLQDLAAAQSQGPAAVFALVDFYGGAILTLPGQQMQIVVDLVPGQYLMVSSGITPPDTTPDNARGMVKPFQVVPRTSLTPEEPEPDLSVSLADNAPVPVLASVPAGPQVWEVTSDGTTPHLLAIAKLLPGKTIDDLQAWLHSDRGGPLPAVNVGAMHLLSPGLHGWALLDLEPGDYVAFDDFPGPQAGTSVAFTVEPS